tara:strand:+ start:291 stop:653 length:363 start_codon:yes stop_codon:yes gene_type:complete
MLYVRLILFFSLVTLSCSRKIVQSENKQSNPLNTYENFSPVEFANVLGNLQCEYHHLSFEIIKGSSNDVEKADKINQQMSYIFELTQDKYINRKNPDSLSFFLFQEELRIVYDSCITDFE